MKQEAQGEFITGHLAATVFERVGWMRSAWKRAKFLGAHASFIDEYKPDSELECQEQAIRMADHFSRLFQRTVRQMDYHRLSKRN